MATPPGPATLGACFAAQVGFLFLYSQLFGSGPAPAPEPAPALAPVSVGASCPAAEPAGYRGWQVTGLGLVAFLGGAGALSLFIVGCILHVTGVEVILGSVAGWLWGRGSSRSSEDIVLYNDDGPSRSTGLASGAEGSRAAQEDW